jgi:hypothetical protein
MIKFKEWWEAAKKLYEGDSCLCALRAWQKQQERIDQLEGYNLGLANESCAQQSRIAEVEKERDQILKTVLDSESNYCALKDSMPVHNLEQTRKGFWLGFEDARCHPYQWNILNRWEGTKVFNEAKALNDQS